MASSPTEFSRSRSAAAATADSRSGCPAAASSPAGRTEDGLPVHSFQTLLADLATLTRNTVATAIAPDDPFTITARPTPIQKKAFDLLGVARTQ